MRKKPLCLTELQKDPFEESVSASVPIIKKEDQDISDINQKPLILSNLPAPKEQATALSLSGEKNDSKRR